MKLYFECSSGISGDMTVAALLDLGVDRKVLLDGLKSLNLSGYHVEISRRNKCGIDACGFDVILDEDHGHDEKPEEEHSHEYYHEHGLPHEHEHHEHHHDHEHEHHEHNHGHGHEHHEHDHNHGHEHHEHDHNHEHVHHEHRGLVEISAIIRQSSISERAKNTALEIFENLAVAESKAHGVPVNEVHFHEVGAVDSIVDTVAVAICLDYLDASEIYFSPLTEGCGTIRCQHGIIPVPVPAVANLAATFGIPMRITDTQGEMVTPTGAAIAATIANDWKPMDSKCKILKVGIGAGKKDFPHANILRVFMLDYAYEKPNAFSAEEVISIYTHRIGEQNKPIDPSIPARLEEILQIEANIDDQTAETLAYAMEKIMEAGAVDCWFEPIVMKKSRPANKLGVLCLPMQKESVISAIFTHTTTIGVRMQTMMRYVCEREMITVDTTWGAIPVKKIRYGDQVRYTPEYEAVRRIAEENDIPLEKITLEIAKNS